jgi:hypothetical protein
MGEGGRRERDKKERLTKPRKRKIQRQGWKRGEMETKGTDWVRDNRWRCTERQRWYRDIQRDTKTGTRTKSYSENGMEEANTGFSKKRRGL